MLLSEEIPTPLPYKCHRLSRTYMCGPVPLRIYGTWVVTFEDTIVRRDLDKEDAREIVHLLNCAWQLGYMNALSNAKYQNMDN